MKAPLKTLLVGLGSIGAAYADDKAMAENVPYVTHAQVLTDHPAFAWEAAVDLSEDACSKVRRTWGVPRVGRTLGEVGGLENIEVVVLGTPPSYRLPVIETLPNLKAVVVEKPLGRTYEEAKRFKDACEFKGLVTQVNLTRRAEAIMAGLACGGLEERIGHVQCGFGVYGNGLLNYAMHTVDLVRMLLGEIAAVQAMPAAGEFQEGPLNGDYNLSFTLFMMDGAAVTLHPIGFSHYREGSLDLWGEKGRMEILQEGLLVRTTSRGACRSLDGAYEVASDRAEIVGTKYGHALFDLYDDLAAVLDGAREQTCSTCASALITERVVHDVLKSSRLGGALVKTLGVCD
jgi:predicted dehydrogenase